MQHDDQESRATLYVLPGMSFTPDSRHLVASYGGKIWKLDVMEGGAEEIPFRVRYDLELWSPAGDWIAYATWDGEAGRLHKARADGRGSPARLTERGAVYITPAWSPAGDRIVAFRSYARDFRESAGGFGSGAPSPGEIVWVADGDGPVVVGRRAGGGAGGGGQLRCVTCAPTR